MQYVVSADGFRRNFGTRQVLKAASFWAAPGTVTAILGRNGSGKSTLLKCAVGLVSAEQGVLHFLDRTYLRPRLHHLARSGVFYLPDRTLLSDRFTVAEHLAAVEWRAGRRHQLRVDELGIDELGNRRVGTLSGGERRRVEIAAAIRRAPVCLLADEPLAGVSPADQERVSVSLRALAADGTAIVITGHEVPVLLALADQVIWMTSGTTHGLGSPPEALRHDQFRREYLGAHSLV